MIVYNINIAGFNITLHETKPANRKPVYMVVYGKQITDNLTYEKAATELGCCIMHALACEGKLRGAN